MLIDAHAHLDQYGETPDAALAELGVYVTGGVEVLGSEHIRSIARAVPSAQLLTEADNPVGAEWLTGTPGMPRLIEEVLRALAELRGTTAEAMARTVRANFARLMGDDPQLAGIGRWLREEPGASGKPP